jgi:putative Holliday junction resolvase
MRIMGIDYGDSRVGIALSDPLGITAQGLTTLPNKVYKLMLKNLLNLVTEHSVDKIVLGMPKNLNGTLGERADVTENFLADLKRELPDMEIVLWDERLTTVQAAGILNVTNTRGKDRKNVIDTVAASIILQSYLDYIKGE